MIEQIFSAFRKVLVGIRPWVMVAPWEQALLVRLGRYVRQLGPGIHLKIPWVDRAYVVGVRLRVTDLGRQTVSLGHGTTVTFSGTFDYQVQSVEQVYRTMQNPEDALRNLARAYLLEAVRNAVSIDEATEKASIKLADRLQHYGIFAGCVRMAEYAVVRTYRVIGDQGNWTTGKMLRVEDE